MKAIKSRKTKITLIILLLVAATAIGVIVTQNLTHQTTTAPADLKPAQKPVEQTPPKPTLAVATDKTLGSGFAVKHPAEWTNVHTGATNPESTTAPQTDKNVITSPSDNIQVSMAVQTNIRTSTNCTSGYIQLKYLNTDNNTTPDYPEGRFAAYVVYFPSINLYQYHAGLQKNTDTIRSVSPTSNTACNFMFSEYIERKSSNPTIPPTYTLLNIKFVDLYNGENLKPGVSEAAIAAKLTGAEYEQAKAIVKSIYIAN